LADGRQAPNRRRGGCKAYARRSDGDRSGAAVSRLPLGERAEMTVKYREHGPIGRALRLLKWLPIVARARGSGAIWRLLRRLARRRPRIWHGQSPLFWEPYLVLADRKAGYPSRAVLHDGAPQRDLAQIYPGIIRIIRPSWFIGGDEIHWRF